MITTSDRLYTRQFFLLFVAVSLFMTGVALQFHFGQFVEYLGFGVDVLGLILSLSVIGTLVIRLRIGRWIDRFGGKPVWLIGTLIVCVMIGSIQWARSLWLIMTLRTVAVMATAAAMTTAAVLASQMAPPTRRAESMGTMGLGGFLGMMIGTTLGDVVFSGGTSEIGPYHLFFSLSALCSLLAGAALLPLRLTAKSLANHPTSPSLDEERESVQKNQPSQWRVIITHWPGSILLVGVVFHMVFCLQTSFLERLAEHSGFKNIKLFFLVYGPTAITLRIIGRRIPEKVGRSPTLVGGMIFQIIGLLALVGVDSQIGLIVPGILMGIGHCFVFPSMIDLAADRLPTEHRGTGTSLILGAGDVGMLIGYAGLGQVIDRFGFDVALQTLAGAVGFGVVAYLVSLRGDR